MWWMLLACGWQKTESELPINGPHHAIVIVSDTLRADALTRAHTPIYDDLVQRGSAARRAWAPSTWTAPSVIAMFTGASVRTTGWDLPMPRFMAVERVVYPQIPETMPTLAQVLDGAGFETVGLYANPLLRRELGVDRGFDAWAHEPSDPRLVQLARQEIAGWDDGRRHFLYIHLHGAHQTLSPSKEAMARYDLTPEDLDDLPNGPGLRLKKPRENQPGARDRYVRAYHAVVEDNDRRVGEILDALGKHREKTVIIFTSDHGEMLGEHNQFGHEQWVYEPLTHVPFVGENLSQPIPAVTNTTILPDLLCQSLGVDASWPSTVREPLPLVSQRVGKVALSPEGDLKGIWDRRLVAYDLSTDPLENAPLRGDARQTLIDEREAWEARVPVGEPLIGQQSVSGGMMEALRELGYLD